MAIKTNNMLKKVLGKNIALEKNRKLWNNRDSNPIGIKITPKAKRKGIGLKL